MAPAIWRGRSGRPTPPELVVLSACRTTERGREGSTPAGANRRGLAEAGAAWRDAGGGATVAVPELATPFARQLASLVPNVVGWDGSVFDRDASDFAAAFYAQLGLRSGVPRTAAAARQALLRVRAKDPQRGRHWHLARVYLGPGGGGLLCAAGKPPHRGGRGREDRTWLDKDRQRVPVATREAFVGRRRAIQRVLRAFQDGKPGVLVHGMGALGKSSLAARVAARSSPTLRTVLVFERYDTLAVFDEMLKAVPAVQRRTFADLWHEPLKRDPSVLEEALEDLLAGPLAEQPVLLIIDDLERILRQPAPGEALTGVEEGYRPVLAAVLAAFDRAAGLSRLLITSRYDFRLPDGRDGDAATHLFREHLQPMPEGDRVKQLRAAGWDGSEQAEGTTALYEKALAAAGGNPGLQEILTRPILKGEHEVATGALQQIEAYRRTGVPPEEIQALIDAGTAKDSDNALIAFFARVSFATYRAALTADEARQLSAATLFEENLPVPQAALAAAGAALGVEAPEAALARLLGLGLLDPWESTDGPPHAAINPLARPLAAPIEAADRPRLARAAFPDLVAAWHDPETGFPSDPRGLQAARLALEAGIGAVVSADQMKDAALAGAAWLARGAGEPRNRQALDLIERARALPQDWLADPEFLRVGAECADALGEAEILDDLLGAPTRSPAGDARASSLAQVRLDLRRVERLITRGHPEKAEGLARSARTIAAAAGDDRLAAIAAGQIADVLQVRGETDEALGIRREEQLPVFERLSNVRSRSVTLHKIAGALFETGGIEQGRIQEIYEVLAEAFAISLQLRLPDGIGNVGFQLAQVMVVGSQPEETLAVLDTVDAAFA